MVNIEHQNAEFVIRLYNNYDVQLPMIGSRAVMLLVSLRFLVLYILISVTVCNNGPQVAELVLLVNSFSRYSCVISVMTSLTNISLVYFALPHIRVL